MNPRSLPPLLAACAATVVATAAAVLLGGAGTVHAPPPGDGRAVLSVDDRAAVAAPPVARGAPAPPAGPGVDSRDPEAVARAYLDAAYSIRPGDAGHTHLRAAAYAVPGSPAAAVGVLVLDPPPAGSLRTATVTALEPVAVDDTGSRRGYRAEVGTGTGRPGEPVAVATVPVQIVLVRQPDGRWLVADETTEITSGEDS